MATESRKNNSQRRVLVVEDDVALRAMLVQFLKSLGHEVFDEGDGTLAFGRVLDLRPDLVLTDLNLPGKSGYEICQQIKADPRVKCTPVLMMTGEFKSEKQKLAGFNLGADDYVLKPVDIAVLAARINAILKQS